MKILRYSIILLTWLTLGFGQYNGAINLESADIIFQGENANDKAGYHLSFAGDVNNDGYDDLLIAAPFYDAAADKIDNGIVYLIFGKSGAWPKTVNLADADASFIGEFPGNQASHDVFGVGDINNDGIDDFGIGVKFINEGGTRAGKVYLFFGKKTGWIKNASTATADVSYVGVGNSSEAAHIYPLGDVNGDGIDDIMVGAGFNDENGADAGKTYVIFGRNSNLWLPKASLDDADASFLGELAGDWAGHRVAGVGDVNGDGLNDFLIGANGRDIDGITNRGIVYLILGKKTGWAKNVSLSQADASFLGSSVPNISIGVNLAGPGDVNGDGLDDMLIGGQNKSYVFLLLGAKAGWTQNMVIDQIAASTFLGEAATDMTGYDIRTLGDVNGDGKNDFIIGAPGNDAKGTDAGKAYLVYGRQIWPQTISMINADAQFVGQNAGEFAGYAVAGGGDVNGDGHPDILIGATNPNKNVESRGNAYLFLTRLIVFAVISPNGGENYTVGENIPITWTKNDDFTTVRIEFSKDNGATWSLVSNSAPNTGTFSWLIPSDAVSNTCLIRVQDAADGDPVDVSNAAFSILAQPQIALLAPNGGENWVIGSTQKIQWQAINTSPALTVELTRDGGNKWETLSNSATGGELTWQVTLPASSNCWVRVKDPIKNVTDSSDAEFTISEPAVLTVLSPNGGEAWPINTTQSIRWSTSNLQSKVKIELSRDNGATWVTVVEETENDGTFPWTVTGPAAAQCLIQISAPSGAPADFSDAPFAIVQASVLKVLTPNGGEKFMVGTDMPVIWDSQNINTQIAIELSRDNGATWQVLADNLSNSGAWIWRTTTPASETCLVKVRTTSGETMDTSDQPFAITEQAGIELFYPNGGETLYLGTEIDIAWLSGGADVAIKIELSYNGGLNWITLTEETENDGLYAWQVSGHPSDSCLMRISDKVGSTSDVSDSLFSIAEIPSLQLTYPTGGESWETKSLQGITWTSSGKIDWVSLELSRDNGLTWQTLADSTKNDGSFEWIVTEPTSATCWIRIRQIGGFLIDVNKQPFTITFPTDVQDVTSVPKDFALDHNYPNPFNPGTTISFAVPHSARIRIDVFDLNGRLVKTLANDVFQQGRHQIIWNGRDESGALLASGLYICKMHSERFEQIRTMLFIK